MPYLQPNQVPILPDITDIAFIHPFSAKRCLIKRTQVPILPAFAMTAHKAQGQSLPNAIIDLQNCRGTESPYVMVSRVTSLDGLLILRNFDRRKISCHQSEETHLENKRLKILRLCTILRCGSNHEVIEAERHLRNLCQPIVDGAELERSMLTDTLNNPNNLLDRLQTTHIGTSNSAIAESRSRILKRKRNSDREPDNGLTPETLNLLYLEQNLIFLSVKNLTMFWILPDVRN